MDSPSSPTGSDPITALLTTYNELNSPVVATLAELPSALEFMRYVALNRPFVVRAGIADWDAVRMWNLSSLKELLKGESVNVAVTPNGKADAPTFTENGDLLFAKPWEEQQSFDEFIDFISVQELSPSPSSSTEVRYAQTQNNNLLSEYTTLAPFVPSSIPFARIALQQAKPDATNIWIGNSRSVTSLHKDPYQNIYCQILGQKSFVLLPPISVAAVGEKELTGATWVRELEENGRGFRLVKDEDNSVVPFPIWDPDEEDVNATKHSRLVIPMKVTLEEGDLLYLPALWYDMEFGGSFYPLCNFVRSVAFDELAS
ncbi:hypothetical protein B7494_g6582 [Chlorociboria aeruginascens]|nr:hypothetical protein B7494_g6582 [Chlorociboria aeruginascens]